MNSLNYPCLFVLALFLGACNAIETGRTLAKEDIHLINSLGLLHEGEEIIKFYSTFKNRNSGNFFTRQRIATYWLADDKRQDVVNSAFYADIIAIDTVYQVGLTYSPYMRITRVDSTQFKVYVGGDKAEIRLFFEEAMRTWSQQKQQKNSYTTPDQPN